MSSEHKIANFIAIFSTIFYTSLILYNFVDIINYYNEFSESEIDDDPDAREDGRKPFPDHSRVTEVHNATEELNWYILMWIFSLLLIVGVKMQNHQAMVPWLLMGILLIVFGFCACTIPGGTRYLLQFTVLGIQTLIWIPIYSYYKQIRHGFYFRRTKSILPRGIRLATTMRSRTEPIQSGVGAASDISSINQESQL